MILNSRWIKTYSTSMLVTVICIVCYLLSFQIGFGGCELDCRQEIPYGHYIQYFVYHFFHANIFHLTANVIALWQFHPRWHTLAIGFIVASLVSVFPFASLDEPTCGLSAVLFACYARKYVSWNLSIKWLLVINLLLAFVPHMNWRIHILAFILAYFYWDGYYCYQYIRGKR